MLLCVMREPGCAAFDEAWKNVVYADTEAGNTLNLLQMAADNVNKSFFQISQEIDLGQDILKNWISVVLTLQQYRRNYVRD